MAAVGVTEQEVRNAAAADAVQIRARADADDHPGAGGLLAVVVLCDAAAVLDPVLVVRSSHDECLRQPRRALDRRKVVGAVLGRAGDIRQPAEVEFRLRAEVARPDAHRVVGIAVLERAATVVLAIRQVRVPEPERVSELVRDEVGRHRAVEEDRRGLGDAGPRAVLLGMDEDDAVVLRPVVAGRQRRSAPVRAHLPQVACNRRVESVQPGRDVAGQRHLSVGHAPVEPVDLVDDDAADVVTRERLRPPGHEGGQDALRVEHMSAVVRLSRRNHGQARNEEGDRYQPPRHDPVSRLRVSRRVRPRFAAA